MKEMFSSERRQEERVPIELFESLVTISDGQRFFVESMTDLSTTGVGIEALQKFHADSRLTMFFPLKFRVKTEGIVRWVRKKGQMYRMGLQFMDMTTKQKKSISEFMHQFNNAPVI